MNNILEQIRVVLVGTTHPGNIGATARAMANMGLTRLHLVTPAEFPSATATAMASGADSLLETAAVHQTLAEALTGCTLVIGASARRRASPWPVLSPREAGEHLVRHAEQGEAALVFGPEQSGLSNKDLEWMQHIVNIPANPNFTSLNLAASVMILAYETRLAWLTSTNHNEPNEPSPKTTPPPPLADAATLDGFHNHLEQIMHETGFLKNKQTTALIRKLRLLFQRARPTMEDIHILRGVLKAVQRSRK